MRAVLVLIGSALIGCAQPPPRPRPAVVVPPPPPPPAAASEAPRRSPGVQLWSRLDPCLREAEPLERAALLWLAWEVKSSSRVEAEELRRAIGEAPSLLWLLPAARPPRGPADLTVASELRTALAPLARVMDGDLRGADVASVATARQALDRLEASLSALGASRLPSVLASPAAAETVAGQCLRLLVTASRLRRSASVKTTAEERRRLLDSGLDPEWLVEYDPDYHLRSVMEQVRAPDAPSWLGPVALVALGPLAPRATTLALGGPLDRRLDQVAARWWSDGDAVAAIASLEPARSSLEEGSGLRRSLDGVVAALTSARITRWRPPRWEAWSGLPDDARLEALDVALRAGAAFRPLPPDAPAREVATVAERLEELGWAALPRLLAVADDEVAGPGWVARVALEPYLGPDSGAAASRAAWWSEWKELPAAAWWKDRWVSVDPTDARAELRLLVRVVREARSPLGHLLQRTLPRPWDREEAAAWCASLVALDRRLGASACDDVLAVWTRGLPPRVAWEASLALARRGDARGLDRLVELGGTWPAPIGSRELVEGLTLLLAHDHPALALEENLTRQAWDDQELLQLLRAHATTPRGRSLLLRVAALALRDHAPQVARDALEPFGAPDEVTPATLAALLVAEPAGDDEPARVLRRTATLLDPAVADVLARGGRHPGEHLVAALVSGDAARVDPACAEVTGEARPWLEVAVGSSTGLPLASAAPDRALVEPLATRVRGWSAITARDVVELLAAWRADPAGGAGLELGLARAPRGRFAARVRPLAAGGEPATFRLETDGVRKDTIVAAGEATDAAIADALATAIVDLLLAPDALVDLRLRVWR